MHTRLQLLNSAHALHVSATLDAPACSLASGSGSGGGSPHSAHEIDNLKSPFEALDCAHFQLFHVKAILISGVGFFTDAYDLFVIGVITPMIGFAQYPHLLGKLPPNVDVHGCLRQLWNQQHPIVAQGRPVGLIRTSEAQAAKRDADTPSQPPCSCAQPAAAAAAAAPEPRAVPRKRGAAHAAHNVRRGRGHSSSCSSDESPQPLSPSKRRPRQYRPQPKPSRPPDGWDSDPAAAPPEPGSFYLNPGPSYRGQVRPPSQIQAGSSRGPLAGQPPNLQARAPQGPAGAGAAAHDLYARCFGDAAAAAPRLPAAPPAYNPHAGHLPISSSTAEEARRVGAWPSERSSGMQQPHQQNHQKQQQQQRRDVRDIDAGKVASVGDGLAPAPVVAASRQDAGQPPQQPQPPAEGKEERQVHPQAVEGARLEELSVAAGGLPGLHARPDVSVGGQVTAALNADKAARSAAAAAAEKAGAMEGSVPEARGPAGDRAVDTSLAAAGEPQPAAAVPNARAATHDQVAGCALAAQRSRLMGLLFSNKAQLPPEAAAAAADVGRAGGSLAGQGCMQSLQQQQQRQQQQLRSEGTADAAAFVAGAVGFAAWGCTPLPQQQQQQQQHGMSAAAGWAALASSLGEGWHGASGTAMQREGGIA
ncbi:MAG: hypothetical protein WDW36_006425 [Sanguina aurantia]